MGGLEVGGNSSAVAVVAAAAAVVVAVAPWGEGIPMMKLRNP